MTRRVLWLLATFFCTSCPMLHAATLENGVFTVVLNENVGAGDVPPVVQLTFQEGEGYPLSFEKRREVDSGTGFFIDYYFFTIPFSDSRSVVEWQVTGDLFGSGPSLSSSGDLHDWSSRQGIFSNPFSMTVGRYYRLTIVSNAPSRISGTRTDYFHFAPEQAVAPPASIELELTYPVGNSPKVFTRGWTFGARAFYRRGSEEEDISNLVQWRGTADFDPDTGASSSPTFDAAGKNTIVLSVAAHGLSATRSYTVDTVSPDGYAKLGDLAFNPLDSHGCYACPHPVSGPITSGSPTVLIDGLPAARQGDGGVHAACCGPNTFEISGGDTSVLIDGRPAAKIGSETAHCGGSGTIVSGAATYEKSSKTLHVPAVTYGKTYWIDLELGGKSPLTFSIGDFGVVDYPGEPYQFDKQGILHIPYVYLRPGLSYWADFILKRDNGIKLEAVDLGKNPPVH